MLAYGSVARLILSILASRVLATIAYQPTPAIRRYRLLLFTPC